MTRHARAGKRGSRKAVFLKEVVKGTNRVTEIAVVRVGVHTVEVVEEGMEPWL